MCLLLLAWQLHPRFDLAVAANRDELHARRTAAADVWPAEGRVETSLLAGRDLTAGGTWLGVTAAGRFAAVTNFAGSLAPRSDSPSRGHLVTRFLHADTSVAGFVADLRNTADEYAGFNLLLAQEPRLRDGSSQPQLWYVSNRDPAFARPLPPGIYGLSNALLDTPWPKLLGARAAFTAWVDRGSAAAAPLHALLEDRSQSDDGPPAETPRARRAASAPFIVDSVYGTRNSTLVLREPTRLQLIERRFDAAGQPAGEAHFSIAATGRTPAAG